MGAIFLLIAIVVLIVYLSLATQCVRWVRNTSLSKWPFRLTIIFWILLPTWDSILAMGYHRYVR